MGWSAKSDMVAWMGSLGIAEPEKMASYLIGHGLVCLPLIVYAQNSLPVALINALDPLAKEMCRRITYTPPSIRDDLSVPIPVLSTWLTSFGNLPNSLVVAQELRRAGFNTLADLRNVAYPTVSRRVVAALKRKTFDGIVV